MKQVCVITGGGSGMGLETAKIMGKTHHIIICGRTVAKLEHAIQSLRQQGISCDAFPCDVGNRESVKNLAKEAAKLGEVQAVIHAAGMSPHMGDADALIKTNAMGTIYMNEEFAKVMRAGSCIIDVSSMSAYLTPKLVMPTKLYKYSEINLDTFYKKLSKRMRLFPASVRPGVAYGVSKDFVIWYAKRSAIRYGDRGIRVVSVSPGNFATPMGKLEEEEADKFTRHAAIKRFGKPEEIAFLFASIVDCQNGYLTGVDILCDGGLVGSGVTAKSR